MRMLSFADFFFLPPSPPRCQGGGGQLERGFAELGRRLCAPPWVPRGQVGSGDGASVRKGISSPRASPMPGREAFPPPSLPLRQWRENWVRQLSPAAWWEGEGAALRFPPDQFGDRVGKGTCGLPHPNPHPRQGLRAEGPILHAAQTHPYARGIWVNIAHRLLPLKHPDSRGSCLQTPLSSSFAPMGSSPTFVVNF